MRDDFACILENQFELRGDVLSVDDKRQFFGAYNNDTSGFQFSLFEKDLMSKLVDHVKKTLDSLGFGNGMSHFHEPGDTKLSGIRGNYFIDEEIIDNIDIISDIIDEIEQFDTKSSQTHRILNKLMETANKNANRPPGGYRFDAEVTSFAVYLRMIAGRMAYQTLQANLKLALPSISTTDRFMNRSNHKMVEGVLRSRELLLYLKEKKQKLVICLSEDATRIDNRIQYDRNTNQLIGFALPINEQIGLPIPFSYSARSAAEMLRHFSNGTPVANFVYTVMARPVGNAPPFCLLIYCSNNAHSSIEVARRWIHIKNELEVLGISVLTISSDSDPRYNAAMKRNSLLGVECSAFIDADWFRLGIVDPPFYIQDYAHILTKLRNLLLKTLINAKRLPFGNYFIDASHLIYLLKNISKGIHGLTHTMLNSVDRQNVNSAKSLCNSRVIIALIEYVKNSNGTVMFLKIMDNFYTPFTDITMLNLDRVRNVWYALFVVRSWREYVLSHPSLTLANHFMSSNCYNCLEINAHSLVSILVYLRESCQSDSFVPDRFDSQACEAFYRQIRSFTSTNSTVANCSMNEILHRIKRIQLLNDIGNDSTSAFLYPRNTSCMTDNHRNFDLPTKEEMIEAIKESRAAALTDCIKFGLIERNTYNGACDVHPFFHQSSRNRPKLYSIPSLIGHEIWSRALSYIKTVTLKNYANQFDGENVAPDSPYVEIPNDKMRIVVKKTSLCWLLRSDHIKLSSDRLQRVKAVIGDKKLNLNKNTKLAKVSIVSLQKKFKKKKTHKSFNPEYTKKLKKRK